MESRSINCIGRWLCLLPLLVGIALGKIRLELVWQGPEVSFLGAPTPVGEWLSCIDPSSKGLALKNLRTGQLRVLVRAPRGQFAYFSTVSRKGDKIAVAWFNGKFYELRVVDIVQSGQASTLYSNSLAPFIQPTSWTPDDSAVLTLFFRRDNISQITLVPVNGEQPRVLRSLSWIYPKRMDLSPDGRWITYDNLEESGSTARDVFLLAVDGSREERYGEAGRQELFPLWWPDGRSILFLREESTGLSLCRLHVDQGRPLGEPEELLSGLGRILPLGISRDGTYFFGLRAGMTDIYAIVPHAGNEGRASPQRIHGLTKYGINSHVAVSPDGKRLAFLRVVGAENYGEVAREIVLFDREAGEEQALKVQLAHIERLQWSPDGTSLLASGSDRRGRGGLYRVPLGGGRAEPVIYEPRADYRGVVGTLLDEGSVIYAVGGQAYLARGGATPQRIFRTREEILEMTRIDAQTVAVATGRRIVVLATGGEEKAQLEYPEGHTILGLSWDPSTSRLLVTLKQKNGRPILEACSFKDCQRVPIQLPADIGGPVLPDPLTGGYLLWAGQIEKQVWAIRGL